MSELIRRGTTADVDAITDLTRRAYAKWHALIGYEPLPMLADYAVAITQHRFDLLEVDGALAALIETELRDDDLLIVNVAVSPTPRSAATAAACWPSPNSSPPTPAARRCGSIPTSASTRTSGCTSRSATPRRDCKRARTGRGWCIW